MRSETFRITYTVLSILGPISFLGPSDGGTPADLGGIPPSLRAYRGEHAGSFVPGSAFS